MKNTKGIFKVIKNNSYIEVANRSNLGKGRYCNVIISVYDSDINGDHLGIEAEANANLINEAFNVANETGMTPRMLLQKLIEQEKTINQIDQ